MLKFVVKEFLIKYSGVERLVKCVELDAANSQGSPKWAADPMAYIQDRVDKVKAAKLDVEAVRIKGFDGAVSTYFLTSTFPVNRFVLGKRPAPVNAKITVTDASDVIQTFKQLTQYTCPVGYEQQLYHDTLIAHGFVRNERGNYWQTVEPASSRTLFVAHLDTADYHRPTQVVHVANGTILETDGTSLLGADDRAGVAILLHMIHHKIPGHYLLVYGEESGCIGSKAELPFIQAGAFDRAIAFDRKGTKDVITNQVGVNCASVEFANALSAELNSIGGFNYSPCAFGLYTDTYTFVEVIPECTNLSVGYEEAHTGNETQDMLHLLTLAATATAIQWESLPTKRTPGRSYADIVRGSAPWYDDTKDDGLMGMDMWGVWAGLADDSLSRAELEDWVEVNPDRAADFIRTVMNLHPKITVDIISAVEGGK